MRRNIHFILFLVIIISFFAPVITYAATCGRCGHSQFSLTSYNCEKCGNYVYVRFSLHNISSDSSSTPSRPSPPIKVRGKGKALIATILIAVGAFLFFDYPWIGIPLIIIGLCFAGSFFKDNSQEEAANDSAASSPPPTGENSPSQSVPVSNVASKISSTRQNNSSRRPTRTSSSSSTRVSSNAQPNATIDLGMEWYKQGMLYCNGEDGRTVDYNKAIECFKKAKHFGCSKADEWLNYLKDISKN